MKNLYRYIGVVLATFVILSIIGIVAYADKPDPTTTTPDPTTTTPDPTVTIDDPTDTVPPPTDTTPAPTDTTPTPTDTTPVPTDTTPVPTDTTPVPTDTTPTPTETTPTPTDTTPVPTDTTPTPTETTPTPTDTTPVPTDTTPTPTETTPTPTETTPVPTNTTPTPTNTTPIPTNTTPAPTQSKNSGGNSGGSSSGSSGGSRGMTTSNVDSFSNIIKYEIRYNDLAMNETVEYNFTTPELGIYQVLVYGKAHEYEVPMRIETLKNKSRYSKTLAPGIIYKNDTILIGNKKIDYIIIRFKINNSWIKENGLDNTRLPHLLVWDGAKWIILTNNVIGKDDNYTYIEAPKIRSVPLKTGSTSLSVLAISAPPKKIGQNNSNSSWSANSSVDINEEEIVPEKIETEETLSKNLPGFNAILIAISIILLAAYFIKKR